jgi:hypothetical protein
MLSEKKKAGEGKTEYAAPSAKMSDKIRRKK